MSISLERLVKVLLLNAIKVTYEGIPDYTFREIIEELYNETMDLHYRIQELKQK